MGIDINGYWEVRDHTDNWMAVKFINRRRNYHWFNIVGGVHGQVEWKQENTCEPWHRGMPLDASIAWRQYLEQDCFHGATWLSQNEVVIANNIWRRTAARHHLADDVNWEKIVNVTMPLECLHVGFSSSSQPWSEIILPWCGTVGDLISQEEPPEQCIRMVIAFDS